MGRGANPQFSFTLSAANGFTYVLWSGEAYNLKAPAGNPGGGLWAPPISPSPINFAGAGAGQVPPMSVPPQGLLRGVDLQLSPAGGWTFSSMRCRIVCPPLPFDPFVWGGAAVFNSAAIVDSWVLFDSGTLAAGAITASAVTPFIRESFAGSPQGFGSWLMYCIDWTTSSGAGSSQLLGTLHADLNEEKFV